MWPELGSNRLFTRLERLLGQRHHSPAEAGSESALEDEVMRQFQLRAGDGDGDHDVGRPASASGSGWGRGWYRGRGPLRLAARVALATVLLGAATATAGRLPVDYALGMGQRVHFGLAAGENPHLELERIMEVMRTQIVIEEVEVMVAASHGEQPMQVTMHLWGPRIDANSVQSALSAALPASTRVAIESVQGRVRTSIADRVAHQWFQHALDADSVDEARQRILAEFAERGIECETRVRVEDDASGHRRIEVRRSVSVLELDTGGVDGTHGGRAVEVDTRCHVFEAGE